MQYQIVLQYVIAEQAQLLSCLPAYRHVQICGRTPTTIGLTTVSTFGSLTAPQSLVSVALMSFTAEVFQSPTMQIYNTNILLPFLFVRSLWLEIRFYAFRFYCTCRTNWILYSQKMPARWVTLAVLGTLFGLFVDVHVRVCADMVVLCMVYKVLRAYYGSVHL